MPSGFVSTLGLGPDKQVSGKLRLPEPPEIAAARRKTRKARAEELLKRRAQKKADAEFIGPRESIGPAPARDEAMLREEARKAQVKARGKKGGFKKFRQKMNISYKKGGVGGAALQLGSSALDAATFNKLAGAGRVSALRGLGGLGALGMLGYMAAKPTYDILSEETDLFGPGGQTQRAAQLAADLQNINYQAAGRSANASRLLENERLKQSIRQNLADVAQNSPALYNQVSAGRRLPRGAVVLGGQQRQDLLMELARAMDRGAFQKQDPLSDLMG